MGLGGLGLGWLRLGGLSLPAAVAHVQVCARRAERAAGLPAAARQVYSRLWAARRTRQLHGQAGFRPGIDRLTFPEQLLKVEVEHAAGLYTGAVCQTQLHVLAVRHHLNARICQPDLARQQRLRQGTAEGETSRRGQDASGAALQGQRAGPAVVQASGAVQAGLHARRRGRTAQGHAAACVGGLQIGLHARTAHLQCRAARAAQGGPPAGTGLEAVPARFQFIENQVAARQRADGLSVLAQRPGQCARARPGAGQWPSDVQRQPRHAHARHLGPLHAGLGRQVQGTERPAERHVGAGLAGCCDPRLIEQSQGRQAGGGRDGRHEAFQLYSAAAERACLQRVAALPVALECDGFLQAADIDRGRARQSGPPSTQV